MSDVSKEPVEHEIDLTDDEYEAIKLSVATERNARRRVENKIEQMKLQKELREFDFAI